MSLTHGQCDTRPVVTFPAVEHDCFVTRLYWVVTEDVNNLPKVVYLAEARPGFERG